MAVDFRTRSLNLPGGSGTKKVFGTVQFPTNVSRAELMLNAFKVDFADDDHHINVMEIDTDLGGHPPAPVEQQPPPAIEGGKVRFTVTCQYADKNFDDAYAGYVTVVVLADRA